MNSSPDECQPHHGHAGDISEKEAEVGILPSHGISLDIPGTQGRPPLIKHLSAPAYQSPLRHHRRQASHHVEVKETLNARSEYTNNQEDGKAEHRINQYIIKDEIGRGSFGAVHLAVDQYGNEFAVKEFSKSRLRKRAQSNILRRPQGRRRPGQLAAGLGLNAPLHRHSASDIQTGEEQGNPLYLIKEEIAIMKKLNHPNLVSLIEVLNDPDEDSLYMVLEMCKKGVVMKVGLGEKSDPYDAESCRCWFRDLILGIEYLHAQGVVHRDIKPDNLLLTEDDVLKIVDFGVSEMFEKSSEMRTAKSAGSPAFLPPELCVTKHGDISGKAADIWSMGVSLYCLRFGRIPFEKSGVLELYEAIKNDDLEIEPNCEPGFCDLMRRLLDKNPSERITMQEIREHSWVTKDGTDPLLAAEENTSDLIEPPSETEVNHAITARMRNLLMMMKAVKKFKSLLNQHKRPIGLRGTLGQGVRTIHHSSAGSLSAVDGTSEPHLRKSKSADLHNRRSVEQALAAEGVHHEMSPPDIDAHRSMRGKVDKSAIAIDRHEEDTPNPTPQKSRSDEVPAPTPGILRENSHEKGHAHDPLDSEPLYLGIGRGDQDAPEITPWDLVAESPTAADFSIYETAYQQEVDRIRAAQGHTATVYLTRRVDSKKEYKQDKHMVDAPSAAQVESSQPHTGFKRLLDKAREDKPPAKEKMLATGGTFSDIASKAVANSKNLGKDLSYKGGVAVDNVLEMATEKTKEMSQDK
ncbi:Calcium/calmodulin-dependent protein kinase kinase [Lachnellula hyalina]|uniref:Calcium/calmodulin-dependent protein kinase kinase n=1 Tax=Lachnellula hyalina TaxID=1316788 RepID=A0A8H8R284_9HELO|nr:Calcium/calmodulin-dependent protein kinase kinase [Lachnellula hyalina]TVY26115.1 Calcium/calmodulin-dependent protein kinase kinase [Lachnellula hyalina]